MVFKKSKKKICTACEGKKMNSKGTRPCPICNGTGLDIPLEQRKARINSGRLRK